MIRSGSSRATADVIASSLTASSTVTSWPRRRSSSHARWLRPLNAEQSRRTLIAAPSPARVRRRRGRRCGGTSPTASRRRRGSTVIEYPHAIAKQVGLQTLVGADRVGERAEPGVGERRGDGAETPAAARTPRRRTARQRCAQHERHHGLVVVSRLEYRSISSRPVVLTRRAVRSQGRSRFAGSGWRASADVADTGSDGVDRARSSGVTAAGGRRRWRRRAARAARRRDRRCPTRRWRGRRCARCSARSRGGTAPAAHGRRRRS